MDRGLSRLQGLKKNKASPAPSKLLSKGKMQRGELLTAEVFVSLQLLPSGGENGWSWAPLMKMLLFSNSSPTLNGLYTPFGSPVPGGQKPQKGRANQQGAFLAAKNQSSKLNVQSC